MYLRGRNRRTDPTWYLQSTIHTFNQTDHIHRMDKTRYTKLDPNETETKLESMVFLGGKTFTNKVSDIQHVRKMVSFVCLLACLLACLLCLFPSTFFFALFLSYFWLFLFLLLSFLLLTGFFSGGHLILQCLSLSVSCLSHFKSEVSPILLFRSSKENPSGYQFFARNTVHCVFYLFVPKTTAVTDVWTRVTLFPLTMVGNTI